MHILYVWAYWQYPELGLEFLNSIIKLGHKVSVYIADFEGDPKPFFEKGIDLYTGSKLDILSKFTRSPYPVLTNVFNEIRKINPDIIHINSHLFLSNFQVAWAAHSLRIPIVVTVHGAMVSRNMFIDNLQKLYFNSVCRLLFKIANRIICLNKDDYLLVSKIVGKRNKIKIIPNGVDMKIFRPSDKRSTESIVWMGRFVPEKGLDYLINAMPAVISEIPNVKLFLIGEGIGRSQLQKKVDNLGISKHVSFLGTLERKNLADMISKSSVFVLPSLREGLPFSVLEAMACGVPVIGSDIAGISSIVDNNVTGILVPPKNENALSKAIILLLKDKDLNNQMGLNSYLKTKRKYTIEIFLDNINKLYSKVIQQQSD